MSTPSTPMVDLNVMTKEPSIINRDDEDMEFILEIEDMQSVISNFVTKDSSYNLQPVRKRRHVQSLDSMYSNYADKRGAKRIKVTESETKGNDYNESDTTIYEQKDLEEFIKKEAKFTISNNYKKNTRSFKTNLPKKTRDEAFFREISQQLEDLCEKYNKSMEEMHTIWMEAC